MRLMDWNIEWMNNWFVGGGQVAWRQSHTGIADVRALAQRVANVITAVDPDVLTLQEGPSDTEEMSLFLGDFLSDATGPLYSAFGGLDGGAQKIYTLVKRNGTVSNPRLAADPRTQQIFNEWLADIDGDMFLEAYEYTRDPLVVDVDLNATGETIRILSLHTKSKFVNQGEAMWNDPNRRQDFVVAALKNRRRISTEAMHTRIYLDDLFAADSASKVIVTGDFNDGPGVDFFEANYLTHGVADIILGSIYRPTQQYEHVLIGNVPANQLFTAIFDDFVDGINDRHLLLDHLAVSPALRGRYSNGRVAHVEYDAQEDANRPQGDRDRFPSDHRPIVVEIS